MAAIMINTRYDRTKYKNAAEEEPANESTAGTSKSDPVQAELLKCTYLKIGVALGIILVASYFIGKSK